MRENIHEDEQPPIKNGIGKRITAKIARIFQAIREIFPAKPDYSGIDKAMLPMQTVKSLRGNACMLGWDDLHLLSTYRSWQPYAWSLAMKTFQDDPLLQQTFLENFVRSQRAETPSILPKDPPKNEDKCTLVDAHKLIQANGRGPNTFRESLEGICTIAAQEGETPALIAHTTLITLGHMLRTSTTPFLIVYPRTKGNVLGHVIDTRNSCASLVTPAERNTDVRALLEADTITLIDDMLATGETLTSIKQHLQGLPSWPTVKNERVLIRRNWKSPS